MIAPGKFLNLIYSNQNTNNCSTGHKDLVGKWIRTAFLSFNFKFEPFL